LYQPDAPHRALAGTGNPPMGRRHPPVSAHFVLALARSGCDKVFQPWHGCRQYVCLARSKRGVPASGLRDAVGARPWPCLCTTNRDVDLMTSEFQCPRCGKSYAADATKPGLAPPCPFCSEPTPGTPPATDAAAPPTDAPAGQIYCATCGTANPENNYRCAACGADLHPAAPKRTAVDDGLGGLIPYKNGAALAAYYLGVFSLIPCFGILLGAAACIFGIIGLRRAQQQPDAKGKVHAWVGIVLGLVCFLANVGVIIAMIGTGAFH